MKKSLLLYFLLLSFPFFCQIKLSDVPLELKKKMDFHQMITTVNPTTNEIYTFAADKEKLFGAKFNSIVFFRDSLTVKRPFNFRYLVGTSFLDNNNPVAYFATEDLSRVIAVEYDFTSRTTPIKDLGLNLKEESILTEFSEKGNFYFITKGKNENALQLIKLEGNTLQKTQLDFKSFSFEINSVTKPSIGNIIDEFGLTKIEKKGFNSFLDGSQRVKYYVDNNKLIITFNHATAKTSVFEIDLDTFSIRETVINNSSLVNVKQSNSLFFENNLVTISSNSSAVELQFIKYEDKSIVKSYIIDSAKSSPFTTPFYSVSGNNSPRNIKTAKKFINTILDSDLGISIYNFDGKYVASFGGLQYRGSTNDLFFELGAIGNLYGDSSGNYTIQNNLVDIVLDSNFKQIEQINQPLFIDKIAQFTFENKNMKLENYFAFKNFYILSYYDTFSKQIVLRKFIDGFDY
ncbi:hypothetical protein SAMN05444372_10814 [Flavobacterium micromati]|uniref:Uncharacterized protein n=1 Tax=Flavobacterium micromati TaxID=229205 RepID=A0A1M5LBH2_9FLAO|nr:hypothetical protein [Flavobacterium micromati]SHG62454.1 hypothetical protein SAMN05444372_10814 [Flavobacterium micromati]